jgi:hypothetical protein
VFVLNCDYGLGIVTKGEPENMLKLTATEIESMTFYDLDNNRELILNLKGPEHLHTFMERRAVSGPAV